MPPQPKAGVRKPAVKGAGPLGVRVGGFPLYVWLGGAVLAVAVGLWFRGRSGGGGAASAPDSPNAGAAEASGSGGSAGSAGFASGDPGLADLADSIWGLAGVIGAGGGGNYSNVNPASLPLSTTAPTYAAPAGSAQPLTYDSLGATPQPIGGVRSGDVQPLPPEAYRLETVQPSPPAALPKATNQQPFGGVVSSVRLPNGSMLTTYGSGRQVQQAPGKSPYVVKRGKGER